MVIGNADIKGSKMLENKLKRKDEAAERSKNAQLQDNEGNAINVLYPSILGQIMESSNSSNENDSFFFFFSINYLNRKKQL